MGAGYTSPFLSGGTLLVGVNYKRHDLQLSYTLGLQKSNPVYWYDDNGIWLTGMTYKQNRVGVRYGYKLPVYKQLISITPQVGYSLHTLIGQRSEGSGDYADGAHASILTLGVCGRSVILPQVSVFLRPEYCIALSQDTYYKHTADVSNFSAGGFSLSLGVMFDF